MYDVSSFVVSPCGQRLLAACKRVALDYSQLSDEELLTKAVGGFTDGVLASAPLETNSAFAFDPASDPGARRMPCCHRSPAQRSPAQREPCVSLHARGYPAPTAALPARRRAQPC